MASIMTLGRTTRQFVLRGTSETIIPDFREFDIVCNFVAGAVNGAPKLRVAVGEVLVGRPRDIKIEIIPPDPGPSSPGLGGLGPGVSEIEFRGAGVTPHLLGRAVSVLAPDDVASADSAAGAVAVRVASNSGNTPPAGSGTAMPPGTVAMINDHRGPFHLINRMSGDLVVVGDDMFPTPDPLPPVTPPQPPGGGGGPLREVVVRDLDPGTDPTGRWRVRIHNLAEFEREFRVEIDHPESVQRLVTTRIPFQLANRAFAEALLLMGPSLYINGGHALLQFSHEFKKLTGLDDVVASVDGRLKNIGLESLTIRLGRDPQIHFPAILVGLDLEDRGDEVDVFGPDGNIADMSMQLSMVLWLSAPPTNNFFSTAVVRHNGVDQPRQLVVSAFITTHPDLRGIWVNILTWIKDVLGGSSFDETIKDMVTKAQASVNTAMSGGGAAYVQDVITQLVRRDHVIHSLSADATDLIVEHHALYDPSLIFQPLGDDVIAVDPTVGDPSPGAGGATSDVPGSTTVLGATPMAPSTSGGSTGSAPVAATHLPPLGSGPPDAVVGPADPPTVAHHPPIVIHDPPLGSGLPDIVVQPVDPPLATRVEHIVFLMLENRSFDHMLGYRALKGHDVRGLTGNEENSIPDGNRPYRVTHLTKTGGIPCPDHGFAAVREQVADGEMSGFASNYIKRSNAVDPGKVMGYYTEAELPMYEFIANNFAICDAWHAAHAGPTWPNRFCATTGVTPEVDNFDVGDQRLGYFRIPTIFDALDRFGVDWCYAEGNVAFLRMFDRHRLDIRNVIPFRDDFAQGIADTWENRVKAGRLPSVSYIDPRFIDIPPSFDANDDLPPTDVCFGQQLVARVYNLLSQAPTWSGTMLVVTYDEHGGFFDHAPPPGTSRAADPSPQPKVHPDGADHLGVRVPALVISPWVDAGTVITTVLDHTSIIKTILDRFAPEAEADGAAFGPRAAAARSLLDELRDVPRTDRPVAPTITCTPDLSARGPASTLERDDFHAGVRYLALPPQRRVTLLS